MKKITTYEIIKLITSGTLRGMTINEITTVNFKIGFVSKPSSFGPGYTIIKANLMN